MIAKVRNEHGQFVDLDPQPSSSGIYLATAHASSNGGVARVLHAYLTHPELESRRPNEPR